MAAQARSAARGDVFAEEAVSQREALQAETVALTTLKILAGYIGLSRVSREEVNSLDKIRRYKGILSQGLPGEHFDENPEPKSDIFEVNSEYEPRPKNPLFEFFETPKDYDG